jgi:hypothetical protein
MECFGTTDFDNNSRLKTSAIIIAASTVLFLAILIRNIIILTPHMYVFNRNLCYCMSLLSPEDDNVEAATCRRYILKWKMVIYC